jgi:hypothetical protein
MKHPERDLGILGSVAGMLSPAKHSKQQITLASNKKSTLHAVAPHSLYLLPLHHHRALSQSPKIASSSIRFIDVIISQQIISYWDYLRGGFFILWVL